MLFATGYTRKAVHCLFVSVILLLTIASAASANIIYTGTGPYGASGFTVDGNNFQIQSQYYSQFVFCGDNTEPLCVVSTSIVSVVGGAGVVVDGTVGNLAPGEIIGNNDTFEQEGLLLMVLEDPSGYSVFGSWRGYDGNYDADPGYFGFRAESSDGYHYGWALAQVGGDNPRRILAYAYESCPDQSIITGMAGGGAYCYDPPASTPEPATAAMLLVCLAGIELFYRRLLKSNLCVKLQ